MRGRLVGAALILCQLPAFAATDVAALAKGICATCHGADGLGIAETFPRLAGQTPDYLTKQMADFLGGKRKNDVMTPFLPQLKGAKLEDVAKYFSALPTRKDAAAAAGNSVAGEQLYNTGNVGRGIPGCVGCHGPSGKGVELNAMLAGQYPSYLVAQIGAFKSGTRNNDKARVMRNAVTGLTEADISAVAAYLAAQ